jgi:hypothetical protein
VFGIISVLLDLDHLIQIYKDGLELNIENIAHHGTRTLHIPILILSGCICIITCALFIRFWHITRSNPKTNVTNQETWFIFSDQPSHFQEKISVNKSFTDNLVLYLAHNSIFSKPKPYPKQDIMVVECPKCSEFIGVLPTKTHLEFPCPYCGILGYVNYS